jgi:ribosomal protein S27AE
VEHFGKQIGVTNRQCSKCGGDLGTRYKKQRYCKKCHAENMRQNRPKHSELTEEARKKATARAYLNTYLRRGKIERKPCSKCGDLNSQGHHEDYNKPLDVIWLCRKHHLELHGRREG